VSERAREGGREGGGGREREREREGERKRHVEENILGSILCARVCTHTHTHTHTFIHVQHCVCVGGVCVCGVCVSGVCVYVTPTPTSLSIFLPHAPPRPHTEKATLTVDVPVHIEGSSVAHLKNNCKKKFTKHFFILTNKVSLVNVTVTLHCDVQFLEIELHGVNFLFVFLQVFVAFCFLFSYSICLFS
jgi:hypothetical protein